MNVGYAHAEWKLVDRAAFEEFLKGCPDYVRDAWADGNRYIFRHNHETFAFESITGNVFVDPQFLV